MNIQLRCIATMIVLVLQPCTAMTLVIKLLNHLFEHIQMCKTRHTFWQNAAEIICLLGSGMFLSSQPAVALTVCWHLLQCLASLLT